MRRWPSRRAPRRSSWPTSARRSSPRPPGKSSPDISETAQPLECFGIERLTRAHAAIARDAAIVRYAPDTVRVREVAGDHAHRHRRAEILGDRQAEQIE